MMLTGLAGAAGARAAARRRARKHSQFRREGNERQQAARDICQKFYTEHTGNLDNEQLLDILTDANEGKPVSDDVFRWCRGVADASDATNKANGVGLRGAELAVDAFYAYKKNEPAIDALFTTYDTDKNGKLEPDELNAVSIH
eukprot:4336412-Pyramimonas_sp.AAC.1